MPSVTFTITVTSFTPGTPTGTCTCTLESSDSSLATVSPDQAITVTSSVIEPITLSFQLVAGQDYSLLDVNFTKGDAAQEFSNKQIADGVVTVTDEDLPGDLGKLYEYSITIANASGQPGIFDPGIETEN